MFYSDIHTILCNTHGDGMATEPLSEIAKQVFALHMAETPGLNLHDLRRANIARLPLFKNRKGLPAHSERDGSDWALSGWSNACLGELGESANIIKKIERGDMTLEEAREQLAEELADVQTYLDILAFRAGIDLADATIRKFNKVSDRVGCNVKLGMPE